MDEHYFTADPSVPFAREPLTCEVWGHRLDWPPARESSAEGGSTSAPRCCSARPSRRHRAGSSTSARGYGVIGLAIAAAWRPTRYGATTG